MEGDLERTSEHDAILPSRKRGLPEHINIDGSYSSQEFEYQHNILPYTHSQCKCDPRRRIWNKVLRTIPEWNRIQCLVGGISSRPPAGNRVRISKDKHAERSLPCNWSRRWCYRQVAIVCRRPFVFTTEVPVHPIKT